MAPIRNHPISTLTHFCLWGRRMAHYHILMWLLQFCYCNGILRQNLQCKQPNKKQNTEKSLPSTILNKRNLPILYGSYPTTNKINSMKKGDPKWTLKK